VAGRDLSRAAANGEKARVRRSTHPDLSSRGLVESSRLERFTVRITISAATQRAHTERKMPVAFISIMYV